MFLRNVFSLCSRSILYTGNMRSGINTWIDIGIILVIRIYILMENFQILANDHFLFYLSWIWSNYMCFFWYYIDIETHVNRNFTTSTFLFFLVFRWSLRSRSLVLFDSSNYRKYLKKTLNNTNSCNNNLRYCFNKLVLRL